jgi:hypothetical protein
VGIVGTDALERVMAEYRQWPGLRLTKRQAARLFWLSPHECDVVFDALVTCGRLQLDARGQYALRSVGRPTMAGRPRASERAARAGHGH